MNKTIAVILGILIVTLLSAISAGITLGLIWVLWWALTKLGVIAFAFSAKTAFLMWLVLWLVKLIFGIGKEATK
jgi:hypothetical protein